MPIRLDGNNTNSVGARVEPLQPEGHEEQAPIFTSHRVLKTDPRQKAHGTRTYGFFGSHQTFQTVRSW